MSLIDDESSVDMIQEPPKVDRRRRPGRRVEILQAVMSLLEKGNRRVTTADLAVEVGLSEAALYRHFTGKQAIFQALAEYLRDHLLRPAGLITDGGSPLLQLRRLFEYHLRFFSEHPGLCRIFLMEEVVVTRSESKEMNKVLSEYSNQVKQIMAAAQEAGELPGDLDLGQATNFLVGLIQSSTLRFVISGFTAHPTGEASVLWTFFCRGVGLVEKTPAP
ncbi:MAG: TetR family transcriptional regulator [Magnetococcales bacterium]|nr:TetR family transcriptional regulator [Magnetococcales bacterium]MBF0439047.1 TetR family transcriptional regulator [Magnetococcales bacterium]